jgi:hypothetical protein
LEHDQVNELYFLVSQTFFTVNGEAIGFNTTVFNPSLLMNQSKANNDGLRRGGGVEGKEERGNPTKVWFPLPFK